jgi:3-oxoacyl-[acyl-carrier-protein] synthase II
MPGSLAGTLALHFQIHGPAVTLTTGCTSAAVAIATAADQLLLGRIDSAIAGGAEAPLHPSLVRQFESVGMLDTRTDSVCRPFDADRQGTVLGEGAAFLVLERLSTAKARGVTPLALLSGWSIGSDGWGRTAAHPEGEGLARTVVSAMHHAGLVAADIGWVCAHGTGTDINDPSEAAAYRTAGLGSLETPVSSIKPVTGHCLGASAALEAVICLQALSEASIPPTPHLATVDPKCVGLAHVLGTAIPLKHGHILNTNQGFFGTTSALCFSAV